MAAALPDIDDIDLGFLDGLDFDLGSFDDLAEFCLGDDAVGAAAADGDKEGGLGLCLSDSDDSDDESSDCSGREGSPDSVVTDDGAAPLTLSSSGPVDLDGGDSMSAYVSELERFLMEDDDEESGRATTATEGEIAADEHKYFFGHLLLDELEAGAGAEEEEEDVAAREDETTSRKRASEFDRFFLLVNAIQQHPSPRAEEVRRCRGAAKRRSRVRGTEEAWTWWHLNRARVSPSPPVAAFFLRACARQQRMAPGLIDAPPANSVEIAVAQQQRMPYVSSG